MQIQDDLTKNGIIFDAKPDAVPYNYRITYKVSIICLMIYKCCGRKGCSLVKMHIIASALYDNRFYEILMRFLNTDSWRSFIVRFDPALNRALEYALADKIIIQQANGAYKLTQEGRALASEISSNEDLLLGEKRVLENISVKLSEDRINELLEGWKYRNAQN